MRKTGMAFLLGCGICLLLSSTANAAYCPADCENWFDGCNDCVCRNGQTAGCTRRFCRTKSQPYCKKKRCPSCATLRCASGYRCTNQFNGCGQCVALPPTPRPNTSCAAPYYFATERDCRASGHAKCFPSINRKGCFAPVYSASFSAASSSGVSLRVAPGASRIKIADARGRICLAGSLVCGDVSGVNQKECDDISEECICPRRCSGKNFGALVDNRCNAVRAGALLPVSGSISIHFVQDCKINNNRGEFTVLYHN
ncbi:hypothetical protein L6R29_18740 [Myxococcota bacterium]|nr:hypothetical protein [Myxococcota bacterium]